MKNFCLILLFTVSQLLVYGQSTSTLNIYLLNQDKESIINGFIVIDGKYNLTSNQYGYVSTNLSTGKHVLQIQHISYKKEKLEIDVQKDTTITIILSPNELESIEISARILNEINSLEDIQLAEFKKIPSVTGEPDIIANLTLLPGISNAKEGNIGFSVRGGETYQNSILVDRSLLLNPSHLFGLFSTINPYVINDVKVYKNHIPSRYGNSSASVIDITIKDGNKDSIQTSLNLGLINSSISIDGPINSKLTFLIGARSAYLGILTSPLYLRYKLDYQDTYGNYNFYDLNLKMRYDFSPSNRITFHVYRSRDNVLALGDFADINRSEFRYFWQSNAFNISQFKQFDNGLFFNNYLTYSNYSTKLLNSIENLQTDPSELTSSARLSSFQNYSFQSQLSKSISANQLLRVGVQLEQMLFTPLELQLQNSVGLNIFSPLSFNLQTLSLYIDNDISFWGDLKLNYGIRYVTYMAEVINFNILEPRLSLKYQRNQNQFFEVSFNKFSQNRIQFPLLNFGLPVDVIIPIYDNVRPPLTNQYNVSFVDNDFIFPNLTLVSSVYYKNLRQLTTIERVLPFVNNFDENFQDFLAFNGEGRAYGLELSLNYTTRKHDFTINYHLSRSERRYSSINDSEWFPHEFDRLQELNLIYSSTINKYWSYYFNFALSSGAPVSLPSGVIEVQEDFFFFTFDKRNNHRLSPFHRLNLSFERKNLSHKNGRNYNLVFSLYNAYYSRNAYDANLLRVNNSDEFVVNELSVFPIIPSISYNTRF